MERRHASAHAGSGSEARQVDTGTLHERPRPAWDRVYCLFRGPACQAGEPDLRKFLFDYVPSYEALEVLLLLVRNEARSWTLEEIIDTLCIQRELAAGAVEALRERGLLQLTKDERMRYLAQRPELDVMVRRLVETHDARRIEIIELLIANALQRMRTATLQLFAEAFRFRGRNG